MFDADDDDRLLKLPDIAAGLGFTKQHTWQMAKAGELPTFRIGKQYRMTKQRFRQFVNELQSKVEVQS